jgi:ketol-acid reductoisomerase
VSDPLLETTVAVLGFGHQGEAQALALRERGVDVIVGARPGGRGDARAHAAGFAVAAPNEAVRRAGVVAVLLPDEVLPEVWRELAGALDPAASLVFAHGFNLLYSDLELPERGDVVLVSPAGPGTALIPGAEPRTPLAAYLAVHRDRTGRAWALADRYAQHLGCSPLWRTTVREETEVDLFGEQTVLCGGLNALVSNAFEILVESGYAPEIAYLECVHQLKYLADLLHARGPAGFRQAISATALYGDLTRGPRVVGPASREAMRAILEEIRSGAFAREWREEVAARRVHLDARVEEQARHPIERARRRALGVEPAPGEPG